MNENIILLGGGGHCRSCIDVIEHLGSYVIAGIIERKKSPIEKVLGYPIIGIDGELPELRKKYQTAFISIGQIKEAQPRERLFLQLQELKFNIPLIVSPRAYTSKHAQIGEGTMVMHDAIVNAGAKIGKNCILNNRTLVEHDSIVADHCHIAPGSILNGEVSIGSGTFVGSGSVICEAVQIGRNCVIAARSIVIDNLPDYSFFHNKI